MRIFFISLFLVLISSTLHGQYFNIFFKAISIIPDGLCSPLSVNWRINYTGVNNAGTLVQIRYDWDDGSTDTCLLYTSDAADDLTRVDLGGRRIIKKKKN